MEPESDVTSPVEDLFRDLRTDAELARLVMEVVAQAPRPFARLWSGLVGGSPDIEEVDARALWSAAVERKRELTAALGRPVHLRVAALDLLYSEKRAQLRPLLVTRQRLTTLVRQATTDSLTGLANRDTLLAVLRHELARRKSAPLALAFFDLDRFKQVNDRFGHARGDEVLRRVGRVLSENMRRGDLASRLAGDEFVVLFVDMPLSKAEAATERLVAKLEQELAPFDASVSAGVVAPAAKESADGFVARADAAMYQRKAGRRAGAKGRAASAARLPRQTPARSAPQPAQPPALHLVPLALYATNVADRFRAVQHGLASLGVMTLPAPTAELALKLWRLTQPGWVFADLMLAPRGGEALLPQLVGRGVTRCALVAPRNWRTLRGSIGDVPVLRFPVEPSALAHVVGAVPSPGPVAALEDVAPLMRHVQRALSGTAARSPADDRTRELAEVRLLQQLLGS